MRPVAFLVLALVCATALAGCSNPKKGAQERDEPAVELPELVLPEGQDFGSMPAPAWKPGYHFRYEDAGALEVHSTGEGFRGNESEDVVLAWGPRQGLNYTVVNTDSVLGEPRALALHRDANLGAGERPDLLAVQPQHLQPHHAYLQDYCSYNGNCTLMVSALDEGDGVAALSFPLKDGAVSKDVVEHGLETPYIPVGPVAVVTRVLGYNEVDGPFGKVRAVHVRQDFRINFTALLEEAKDDAPAGITDLNITGELAASRDVLYAPDLLNVVLDQSTSEGRYTWSFRKGGQPQVHEQTWRAWSRSRLADASFEPQPAMPLAEIGAMLRFPTSSANGAGLLLSSSAYDSNLALREAVTYEATTAAQDVAAIRIDILDAHGSIVSTQHGRKASFQPPAVGPYLVVAYAHDEDGVLVDRDYATLYAYYQGQATLECDPLILDGSTSCDSWDLPEGSHIQFLAIGAAINEPATVASTPGRLVLDIGDGREISSERTGSTAYLWLEDPGMGYDIWSVTYRPDAAVGMTVDLDIDLWPGSVPSWVYMQALAPY